MLIAITGTPGTGKTSLGRELESRGRNVIFLSEFIEENGLLGEFDEEMGSYDVDTDELDEALEEYRDSLDIYYLEGHLSHFVKTSKTIVLRCAPEVLAQRLGERGYSRSKVTENVHSEILDIILCESSSTETSVYELDSTSHTSGELADLIFEIEEGTENYRPGDTDWTGEMDKWF